MTEKRHRTGENSGKNAEKTAVRVARRCVRLRQGGEAALCVLDTGDAPERERDSLTSMGAGVVLSSTAVRLGEHGTVHELAEGELFRWAYIRGFDELRFTHPIALSAGQCMVHLRLTNAREKRKRRRRSTQPRPRWQQSSGSRGQTCGSVPFFPARAENRE